MKKLILILFLLLPLALQGQQVINIGTNPNDGTGDPLRTAFTKVNTNFVAVYDSLSHIYTKTQVDSIFLLYYTQTALNTLLAAKQDTGVVSMTYPAAGIALSTGSAWGTSITNSSANWNTAYSDRLKWDGGSTGLVAATGRTSLGGTTVGQAFFTLTNPSAITFPRINADNTVTALSAAAFTTAIGASHIYSDTMSISAGVLRTKVTTITTEPYSVQIFSSTGKDITHAVSDSVALNGGVYKLYVYSVDALSGCKIKILY